MSIKSRFESQDFQSSVNFRADLWCQTIIPLMDSAALTTGVIAPERDYVNTFLS
jgi:hypothetical protein